MSITSEIKEFVDRASNDLLRNDFVKIESSKIASISEGRFNSFVETLVSASEDTITQVEAVELILDYLSKIEKRSSEQISYIIANEKAKAMYHLLGMGSDTDMKMMTIVDTNGLTYSSREKGWVLE
jgi:phosphoribosyl-ATP pyrophosphohydrolase